MLPDVMMFPSRQLFTIPKGRWGGGCPSSVSSVSLRTLLPEVDSTSDVKIDETESRDYPPKSHGLS